MTDIIAEKYIFIIRREGGRERNNSPTHNREFHEKERGFPISFVTEAGIVIIQAEREE